MRFFKKTLTLLCALLALAGCSKAAEGEAPSETPAAGGGERTAFLSNVSAKEIPSEALFADGFGYGYGSGATVAQWLDGTRALICTYGEYSPFDSENHPVRIFILDAAKEELFLLRELDLSRPPLIGAAVKENFAFIYFSKEPFYLSVNLDDNSVEELPCKVEYVEGKISLGGFFPLQSGNSFYGRDAFGNKKLICSDLPGYSFEAWSPMGNYLLFRKQSSKKAPEYFVCGLLGKGFEIKLNSPKGDVAFCGEEPYLLVRDTEDGGRNDKIVSAEDGGAISVKSPEHTYLIERSFTLFAAENYDLCAVDNFTGKVFEGIIPSKNGSYQNLFCIYNPESGLVLTLNTENGSLFIIKTECDRHQK